MQLLVLKYAREQQNRGWWQVHNRNIGQVTQHVSMSLPQNRLLETCESISFAHLSVGSCVASLAAAVVAVVGT